MTELTLFVDHDCNLRCSYCYNGRKFGRSMSLATARRALDLALGRGDPHLDLSFFGGEPLLHLAELQAITDYAEQALSAMPEPRASLRLLVNTNGTLMSDAVLDWLAPPRVATVFVSLDGPREIHDRHRVDPQGRGSFDRVREGLLRMRERGIAFQLLSVVNVDTAPHLGRTVDVLLSERPFRATLSVNYRDDWTDEACEGLRHGLRAAGDVWMAVFRAGSAVQLDPLHTKILTHLKGGVPCPSRCYISGADFTVTPTGRIYACAQQVGEDDADDRVLGHVDRGIDQHRLEQMRRQKERVEQVCAACELRDRCQSHCGCRHLALTGRLGEITAALCETEAAFIEAADRVAETLYAEQCEAFMDFYYRRAWEPATGSRLSLLRTARDRT